MSLSQLIFFSMDVTGLYLCKLSSEQVVEQALGDWVTFAGFIGPRSLCGFF